MKVRFDFASNSSSSSFICLAEDASNIELFNESKILSLHEYLNRFGEQDIMPWYWCPTQQKMEFVDDEEFSRRFATNVNHILPLSAKEAYIANQKDWKDIMPYVERVLMQQWETRHLSTKKLKTAYYIGLIVLIQEMILMKMTYMSMMTMKRHILRTCLISHI